MAGRTAFSKSFLSAARFTQAGPPAAHWARRTNPYPSDGPREAAAGSGRLERHGLRRSKGGLNRLGARGNLIPLAYGRIRPLSAGQLTRVRVARMPRPTREVREPATRPWRVGAVSSKSFVPVIGLREDGQTRQHDRSAVRLTQVGPPAVHQARRANSYPSHWLGEVAAASGRLELNTLPGSRS